MSAAALTRLCSRHSTVVGNPSSFNVDHIIMSWVAPACTFIRGMTIRPPPINSSKVFRWYKVNQQAENKNSLSHYVEAQRNVSNSGSRVRVLRAKHDAAREMLNLDGGRKKEIQSRDPARTASKIPDEIARVGER